MRQHALFARSWTPGRGVRCLSLLAFGWLILLGGCGSDIESHADPCSVNRLPDGSVLITCPDGSEKILQNAPDGTDGRDGQKGQDTVTDESCDTHNNPDGTRTITCGDQDVTVGFTCEDGYPGNIRIDGSGIGVLLFEQSGCTSIRGSLTISMASDRSDIPHRYDVFQTLEHVQGNVKLLGAIPSDLAFPRLEVIGGDLSISETTDLQNLYMFSALESIVGSLIVLDNDVLDSLDGLDSLVAIGGASLILSNARLQSVASLHDVVMIGENLFISGSPLLVAVRFDALPSLTTLELSGLSGLETIDFPALTTVDGIFIGQTDTLTTIDGFTALDVVGERGIVLVENDALTSVPGFSAVHKIDGPLTLSGNAMLTSLAGFGALTSVAKGDLPSFIDKELRIEDNDRLHSLQELAQLQDVGGSITIIGNDELEDVAAFSVITTIEHTLTIRDNAALLDLNGFASLTELGQSLFVENNATLTSLDGFDALTTVGNLLYVTSNSHLASIEALAALSSVGGEASFVGHPLLPSCQVDALATRLSIPVENQDNDGDNSLCD